MSTTTPGATTPAAPAAPPAGERVELSIGGMTCASCAARIEKKLNRMDGVQAVVNFATERARVDFGPGVSVADLIATVERTGYTAAPPAPPAPPAARDAGEPTTATPIRSVSAW